MSELQWICCTHCQQMLLDNQLEKCSVCGKVGGLVPAEVAARKAREGQARDTPQAPRGVKRAGGGKWGKWCQFIFRERK